MKMTRKPQFGKTALLLLTVLVLCAAWVLPVCAYPSFVQPNNGYAPGDATVSIALQSDTPVALFLQYDEDFRAINEAAAAADSEKRVGDPAELAALLGIDFTLTQAKVSSAPGAVFDRTVGTCTLGDEGKAVLFLKAKYLSASEMIYRLKQLPAVKSAEPNYYYQIPEEPMNIRENRFSDVQAADWYYDYAQYADANGLMQGTAENTFSPNGTLTRAMAVTILHRIAGAPAAQAECPFTDVSADAWYADAVRWAAESGIVQGISRTQFAPDAPIKRGEMAALLCRYADWEQIALCPAESAPTFADDAQIPAYAKEAAAYLNRCHIITGRPGNLFDSDANMTRAEAAAILYRFTHQFPPID